MLADSNRERPVSPGRAPILDSDAVAESSAVDNVARLLPIAAQAQPFARAVIVAHGRGADGRRRYSHATFAELDRRADEIAWGLVDAGLTRGMRTLLAVKPSIDFVALVFALFKIGAVPVLIDPGMGRRNLLQAVARAEPEAVIAIPIAHALRKLIGGKAFATVRLNITVGRRLFWGGHTLAGIIARGREVGEGRTFEIPETDPTETAGILYTTGATGPPKGVIYQHGMFTAQVRMLRDAFDIGPGDVDLPGLPVFALFSVALGATVVLPTMNPSRPGQLDPELWIERIRDHGVTFSFGSPVIWHRVTRHCLDNGVKLPSLRLVLMAGAPVPPGLLSRFTSILTRPDAQTVTPYGATECLPATTITGRDVLGGTAARTRDGGGICVGEPLPEIDCKLIRISDEPIADLTPQIEVPTGEPGEICFAGPVVTESYFGLPDATVAAKMLDADGRIWHRMGDVGVRDADGRLWFWGRKKHRVGLPDGRTLFPVRCEAIFLEHPDVYRAALVGVGEGSARRPVIIIEPHPGKFPRSRRARERFLADLRARAATSDLTREIADFLFHRSFPVDYRHNAKIIREQLAVWAAGRLA
jgi:acyl-CoA synthetase (AMP-forming)/AMP-acid ligase II